MMKRAIATILLMLAAAQASAELPERGPQRVVSLNLCTDLLVLALADPAQIASLSFLAWDKSLSPMAEQAKGFPSNRGRLEEVVALRPDLVVAGRYGAQATVARLRQLGIAVLELDIAQDFASVIAQAAVLAQALGRQEQGRAYVAGLQTRIAGLRAQAPSARPMAAILDANGLTLGGQTLADAVLGLAGFDNAARAMGVKGLARLGLEQTLLSPAQILVLYDPETSWPSQGQAMLDHAALQRRFPPGARISVPRNLWICGGPSALDAAELLAGARQRLGRAQ